MFFSLCNRSYLNRVPWVPIGSLRLARSLTYYFLGFNEKQKNFTVPENKDEEREIKREKDFFNERDETVRVPVRTNWVWN